MQIFINMQITRITWQCKGQHRATHISSLGYLWYLYSAATKKLSGLNYIYRNFLAIINITRKTFLLRVGVLQILQLTCFSINLRFDPRVHSLAVLLWTSFPCNVMSLLSCMRTRLFSSCFNSSFRTERYWNNGYNFALFLLWRSWFASNFLQFVVYFKMSQSVQVFGRKVSVKPAIYRKECWLS